MLKKASQTPDSFDAATPLVLAKRACYPALITVFALSLFINVAMLTLPLFSMQLYDRVLSSGNINTLVFLAMIAAFFLILSGILDYARAGILVRAGHLFEERLRGPLFNTLFHSSTQSSPASIRGGRNITQTGGQRVGKRDILRGSWPAIGKQDLHFDL